jgi:hypothetical protein
MSQTLSQLVQRTVTRLSMVGGVSVQVYAEDRIAEMIWHKFVMVRDELWWDEFMDYITLTQDTDGRPVENVVRDLPVPPLGDEVVINTFTDIQYGWHPQRRDPLRYWPRRANPAPLLVAGGADTLYMLPDQRKVVRFAPFRPGLVMTLRVKRHYAYFKPNDVVPMDEQLLILGACYDYLEDDGTNAGQTEKFRNMFNDRLRQLKGDENEKEIPLHPVIAPPSSGYQVI